MVNNKRGVNPKTVSYRSPDNFRRSVHRRNPAFKQVFNPVANQRHQPPMLRRQITVTQHRGG